MIIKSIKLAPFAGSAFREYRFNDGLNVLLGPNESGKSTFVNALKTLLFVNTDLSAAKFKTFMTDFMPIGGGDTINVSAELFYNNTLYKLEKYWGATKSTKLTLDSGQVYTSVNDIASTMSFILGLNQGTYENVLIIRQSSLAETIKAIESEAQASESIQQILRNSKFKMDGVSVPKLKKAVDTKLSEYFDHWDIASNSPEGMRDIDNEWKVRVGQVLSSYYKYRKTERAFRKAGEYELQLDEFIKKIECFSTELKRLEDYIEKYRQVYQDISKRKNLELQKEIVSRKISELMEVQKVWPKYETEKEYLSREITELNLQLSKLQEEEKNAEKFESQRSIREKYNKAHPVYNDYLTEKIKLNELQKVTKQDLEELSKASKLYNEYRIKFEAQKLKLKVLSKEDISFNISEGFQSPKIVELKKDQDFSAILSGRLSLQSGPLSFTVTSGNGNVDEIIENLESAKRSYASLLEKHSVSDEAELARKAEQYKNQYDAAMVLANELKKILTGQLYNDLEKQYQSLEDVSLQRPLREILKNISDIREKRKDREKDYSERERQITKWQEKYSTHENLSDIHAEAKIEMKKLEAEIEKLKPLPGEFNSIETFIKDFEIKDALFSRKKDELAELKIKRAEFEKNQTEASTKELEIEMNEAKERFEKVKKEGEAFLIIKSELEKILQEIDKDTFEPLKIEVSMLLKQMTLNKYSSLVMDEVVPRGIKFNGSSIPVELLSAGTKDILALAVRLGMANFYLQNRRGFIIMDDPLVNLDPERQKVAVESIKSIAETKQIILLTCHPSHAELFGSGIVNVSGN
ncbi:MAG: AAA family ATPase [Bacteroidota bacterium]|nr:AAA family ATPase [Bacteroidota bacterium]